MNTEEQSQNGPRAYDNTLRQEQALQTRLRILEAAVEMLSAGRAEEVTLAQVARAAGVSEPTLYRHFGSRDRLYEAIEAHAQARLGVPPMPDTLAGMPAHLAELFELFGAHAPLVRALVRTRLGREVRARGRARRQARFREMVARHAPELDEASLARATGALRVLASWESFEMMTGELGLTTQGAAEAVTWATRTLLDGLVSGTGAANGSHTSGQGA